MSRIDFYKNQAKNVRITPRKQMILQYVMPYLRPDLKVLDVGCGDGYIANCMNIFSKVTAFDGDVTYQKQRYPRVNFISGDSFISLPNPAIQFDIVTVFDVLEHVSNRKEALGIIVERTKKYIIFNQPDQEDKSQPFDMVVTPRTLIKWMKEFELTIIELRHIKLGPTESYNFMVFRRNETYRSSWY